MHSPVLWSTLFEYFAFNHCVTAVWEYSVDGRSFTVSVRRVRMNMKRVRKGSTHQKGKKVQPRNHGSSHTKEDREMCDYYTVIQMLRYQEGALRPESRRYVSQGFSELHVSRKIFTNVRPLSYPVNLSTSTSLSTTQLNSTIRTHHDGWGPLGYLRGSNTIPALFNP